jgi:predicted PurR-regulated permease PerM
MIHSTSSHPIPLRCTLILSSHLSLVLFIMVSFFQFFLLKPFLSQEGLQFIEFLNDYQRHYWLNYWTKWFESWENPEKNKSQGAEQLMRQFVLYLQSSTRYFLAPKLLDTSPNFLSVPFLKVLMPSYFEALFTASPRGSFRLCHLLLLLLLFFL